MKGFKLDSFWNRGTREPGNGLFGSSFTSLLRKHFLVRHAIFLPGHGKEDCVMRPIRRRMLYGLQVRSRFLEPQRETASVRVMGSFTKLEKISRDSTILYLVRIKTTKPSYRKLAKFSGWNSHKLFKPGLSWIHLIQTLSPLSLRTTTACSAFKSRGPTSIRRGTPCTEMIWSTQTTSETYSRHHYSSKINNNWAGKAAHCSTVYVTVLVCTRWSQL